MTDLLDMIKANLEAGHAQYRAGLEAGHARGYREGYAAAMAKASQMVGEAFNALEEIVRDGDYTNPEGMKLIAKKALNKSAKSEAFPGAEWRGGAEKIGDAHG